MGDLMRAVPFSALLDRIFSEYRAADSIFGLPARQWYRKENSKKVGVFGEECTTAVGPAAGPHTQLAQNIVTAYLAGGRFMELKTVQQKSPHVGKPCIDAEDECFNTEWSSEYEAEEAFDEYLKAWFVLHVLEDLFDPQPYGRKSFIFNMSVGYDLAGIKSPRMDKFINDMLDASEHPKFKQYQNELRALLTNEEFLRTIGAESLAGSLAGLADRIPGEMCKGVTLSTMHGCPPEEIEKICHYMLTEKKINTYTKLNPTLLGFKRVREILDNAGFDYVGLKEESFSHDLQWKDAAPMLHRLKATAKEMGLDFGVKLTNTLGTINGKGRLPDAEMYMSGRALFPLSMNVADLISREFNGEMQISYSGGATKLNMEEIFACGIRPITIATDLLKPGGYQRMTESAYLLDEMQQAWNMSKVDVSRVSALAEKSLTVEYTQKLWRLEDEISVPEALPLNDCYVAPCKTACAISQDIPEYIKLVGAGKYAEALELIYVKNALPSMTGHICDHQCEFNCTRRDYEGAVNIREIKKVALLNGWETYKAKWSKPAKLDLPKVAVIGAGPAGLSAGYFLARSGFPVTIMEKEQNAGGVVKNIIPKFRIPAEAIQHDIDFVAAHGVEFQYGCNTKQTIADLKAQGYKYICVGIGADKGNHIEVDGAEGKLLEGLDFLTEFNAKDGQVELGKNVITIGAGNTAMDIARAALKTEGVESSTIVYRRSQKEMPAWWEEYEHAAKDGVQFSWLTNPEKLENGQLTCRVMELGEADEKGRRRPVATDKTVTLACDSLIAAIGESADRELMAEMGISMEDNGWADVNPQTCENGTEGVYLIGDVNGPNSIVAAIGQARKAADNILAKEKMRQVITPVVHNVDVEALYDRKGDIPLTMIEDSSDAAAYGQQEAARCLECNYICNKCVDVCPNRANLSLAVPGFNNQNQIVHVDAYCNECGNCGQFCPWNGRPYKDKLTVFNLMADFEDSTNPGFIIEGNQVTVRQDDKVYKLAISGEGSLTSVDGDIDQIENSLKVISYIYTNHNYLLGEVEA